MTFTPRQIQVPGLELTLIPISVGTFDLGSPDDESRRFDHEGPQTRVTISQGFWLGKYAVTQGQYEALMGTNPSHFTDVGKDAPVEQVSWDDAMIFCRKLTKRERVAGRLPTGYVFTLPTEAQWEYACRAGTTGPYAGYLDAMAWYEQNSGKTTHQVGTKQPNAWGLYDMEGNVLQWCLDRYEVYHGSSVSAPSGAGSSTRVLRGGSWVSYSANCRSAFRLNRDPDSRFNYLGFRVALSAVR